ncbi:MAG TPA: LysM domain-containing protein [Acidimicrobiia bacterium]|nr:LysM domain-containing protein [Acidimicrobiia bacterium]
MAAVTTMPGPGVPAFPSIRRYAPRGATPRARRVGRATYLRRRLAVAGLACGLVVVAAQAGAALGGSPLAAPERRPTAASAASAASSPTVRAVVVRPGDSLWSIAERLAPDEDPRPVVDEVQAARGDAPLVPGETILWPR